MMIQLDIRDPIVNITDREEALIKAHNQVFPASRHLLCVWHINRNMVANCKPFFYTKEDWVEFYTHWFRVKDATTVATFKAKWKALQEAYNHTPEICSYLARVWIDPYTTKFVQCYTNRTLHFFNTTSSKSEGGHTLLKRELRCSTSKKPSFRCHFYITTS